MRMAYVLAPCARCYWWRKYGCNPTRTTATIERHLEVLAPSRQQDVVLFLNVMRFLSTVRPTREYRYSDDPYYCLYCGKQRVLCRTSRSRETNPTWDVCCDSTASRKILSVIPAGCRRQPICMYAPRSRLRRNSYHS